MKRLARRPSLVLVAIAATALVAGGIAWAAIPDSSGAINACYHTSTGKLRAVDSPGDCGGGETAIALGGPTRAYVDRPAGTVVVGTTSSDVASLTLPAGRYVLHGKVNAVDFGSSGNVLVACSLQVGASTIDQTWVNLGATSPTAPSASIGLQGGVTLATGGAVAARCAAPNGEPDVTVRFSSLDAISVDGLTLTP
jgi:hypothetical protein